MAFSLSHFPSSLYPLPASTTRAKPSPNYPIKPILNFTATNRKKSHRFAVIVKAAADEEQQNPTTGESETPVNEDLGTEIKKAMMEREVKKDESIWTGVAEEIGQIEWPAFNKVIGTTGVVLGVIAGSSVVLLTVNAVLAELSDRVFAGRGVQDFFG